jgi:hypothetical protein
MTRRRIRRSLARPDARNTFFRLAVLPPLVLDGDIDQRFALADLLGELEQTKIAINDAIDNTKSVLRQLMATRNVLSVSSRAYDVRLRPESEMRCVAHHCPPRHCAHYHPNRSVVVEEVNTGYRYFSVTKRNKLR